MKHDKPILKILVGRGGVYQVDISTSAYQHDRGAELAIAIKPALEIIDAVVGKVYAYVNNPVTRPPIFASAITKKVPPEADEG